jgi:hypothetical protein
LLLLLQLVLVLLPLGRCQLIVCVAGPANVACVMCGASVTWLCFFVIFHELFIASFVVDIYVLVSEDLRHEFTQSA